MEEKMTYFLLDTEEESKIRKIVIDLILKELEKAEEKHPNWPDDQIHAVAIMIEEAGEAMQAAIDFTYENDGDIRKLRLELAQTGAMAFRALFHTFFIDENKG